MKYFLFLILIVCLLQACQQQPTERIEGFEVHGIDVSHHQELIDWDTVAAQHIDFAFMKATEGEELVDRHFKQNWEKAKSKGFKRGAYHFFHPTLSSFHQAINFINTVPLEYGDLPPVIDFEVTNNATETLVVNRLRSWLDLIEKHYQVRPIIYTNQKLYKQYIAGNFDEYIIWMARYSTSQPTLVQNKRWHFWQYGNRGTVRGIEGDVDLNVFNGSILELEKICHSPSAASVK